MSKTKNTTSDEVRTSVASIYSELLSKRKQEKEAKEEKKRQEEELYEQEKEAKKQTEDGTKLSKKERREAEFDNWKEVIVGLTGDDLEYSSTKKSKKKYRKWIDDETESAILTPKPKKIKKRNYSKEFAPELQMLKNIVADQNKFTADLQKRFNTMAGPATKDAMPPNKTMVDLASVINAGRSNSLGVLKEIGNLKKVVAELYMKQRKEDGLAGGAAGAGGPMDLALMGSNIASSLFSDNFTMSTPVAPTSSYQQSVSTSDSYSVTPTSATVIQATATSYPSENNVAPQSVAPVVQQPVMPQIQEFDPSSWDGPENLTVNDAVKYETVPHTIVVEMNKDTNECRFKAIHNSTGEELQGCPVPTYDPRKLTINEKDLIAKGQFDESYKLEIV